MKQIEFDFTTGNIIAQMVRFGLPLLAANLLQQLYSIVDMVIVGRFVGSAGLSAVSSCAQFSFVMNAVCMGVSMGGTVLVAQCRGAGDMVGQSRTAGTLFFLSFIGSGIITAMGLACYRPVLSLLQVPPEAERYAYDYMRIICAGSVFVFGYNAVCAVLRGAGDSKSPFYFVTLATVVNIGLDLLLTGYCEMGTAGAALATIASQAASFAATFICLYLRRGQFIFRKKDWLPDWQKAWLIIRIGLPSAVQMAVVNLSYLVVTGLLNGYGVAVSAAAGIGLKINTFAAMPCWAVGSAVTTMTGQNIGAENFSRAKQVCMAGIRLSVGFSAITTVLFQVFAPQIIRLFDTNAAVVAEGVRYLRICCSVNFIAYACMYQFDSFATGAGDARFAMLNAVLQAVLMRVVFSWVAGVFFGLGPAAIYWCEMISPVLPAVLGAVYLRRESWKKHGTALRAGNSHNG